MLSVSTNEYLAALDLGTNTVLLLTARAAGADVVEDRELCETTRLGEGLARTGMLLQEAVTRTVAAAAAFRDEAAAACPAGRGIAVATSAVRGARNRAAFLDACRTALGHSPLLYSGAEEAETAFLGAASDQDPGAFLVTIDIGGGSTELSAGRHGERLFSTSVDLGCVRYAEEFGLKEQPQPGAIDRARRAAAAVLGPVGVRIRALMRQAAPVRAVVSGGTGTTYAQWVQEMPAYDRTQVHGFAGARAAVGRDAMRLWELSSPARAELPGLPAARAEILPAGLLILTEALGAIGLAEFRVTTRGLRYGLILRLARGDVEPSWTW